MCDVGSYCGMHPSGGTSNEFARTWLARFFDDRCDRTLSLVRSGFQRCVALPFNEWLMRRTIDGSTTKLGIENETTDANSACD